MEEAEVCDKIAIIDNGKIIAIDTPDELKKTLGGDVIYIRTSDNIKARSEIEEKFGLDVSEKDGELFMTCSMGDACIPEILRSVGDVQSVRLQRPTLNDVFLKMTGKDIRDEELSERDVFKETIRSHRRRFSGS